MAKEYRGRIRILGDILHATNVEPGIGTTRLLFLSNLSHDRLTDYLAELKDKGLVEERDNDGRRNYHLTEKGHRFLAEVRRIQNFMADFGLEM
jgi:predicted transcriptional regulator